ncbi:GlsB/YeaQ/YmgE family stress response membrane protein [Nevskia ramosa]|uniref:GlsB/YeaQ/YmgE family stress response membrane protein n=1 Tax=Nevskia ramosa TaxID=64002 RepID=UPI0003B6B9C9|nr:GlsB/YeaQ/YmgE family stress response membrane protein [Nevskia ramosa]
MIWTLFIGFVVGLVARFLKPGNDGMGIILTTVLGIAGSAVASYGGKALGLYQPGEPAGFIGALIGAVVLLFIVGAIRKRN